MKTRLGILAGLTAGGLLGWLTLRNVAWGHTLESVIGMDWRVLALALGAVLLAALLESYRWKLLLPHERVSLARLFFVRNVGRGLNNVSPLRVFGEVAETAMLGYGNSISPAKVVSSLVISRLLDLAVTVTLVGVGLIVLPQLAGFRPVVLSLWGIGLAGLVGLVVLGERLHRMPLVRQLRGVTAVLRAIGALGNRRRVLLGCALLTATTWMSIGTASWLVAHAAGVDLPFWLMCMVIVAVTFFSSTTPAPPAAVGVYEFGAISTLGLFAVDPGIALTFALVIHAVLFLPSILIAMGVLAYERKTMRQVASLVAVAVRPRRREAGARV